MQNVFEGGGGGNACMATAIALIAFFRPNKPNPASNAPRKRKKKAGGLPLFLGGAKENATHTATANTRKRGGGSSCSACLFGGLPARPVTWRGLPTWPPCARGGWSGRPGRLSLSHGREAASDLARKPKPKAKKPPAMKRGSPRAPP